MPFALIIIGLVMIVTGARNTHAALGDQIVSDFTGEKNFTYWVISIGSVGALGYVKPFEEMSRMFMLLIILAMVIKNGAVFDKLMEAIRLGPEAPAAQSEPTISSAAGSSGNTASNDGNTFSKVADVGMKILPFLI